MVPRPPSLTGHPATRTVRQLIDGGTHYARAEEVVRLDDHIRLAELRVLLQGDEKRSLTETWSYQWISKDTQ